MNNMEFEKYMDHQRHEINRHKWIESEKAGRDLGSEAVLDWIRKYASVFRENWSQSSFNS